MATASYDLPPFPHFNFAACLRRIRICLSQMTYAIGECSRPNHTPELEASQATVAASRSMQPELCLSSTQRHAQPLPLPEKRLVNTDKPSEERE